jgi:hypothetical protein
LVFGEDPKKSLGLTSSSLRLVNRSVIAILLIGVAVVPGALLYKNLPTIRTSNGGALKSLPTLSAQALPQQGSIVLSEDAKRLEDAQREVEEAIGHRRVNAERIPTPSS